MVMKLAKTEVQIHYRLLKKKAIIRAVQDSIKKCSV